LESISAKLNPFWRDTLLNLSELLPIKDQEEKYIINILSQPIWLNFNIKRNCKVFIIEKYCYNGVFVINDIVSEGKEILSYQEFQNKYMTSTNFLEYYGIVQSQRDGKKKLISEYGRLHDIKNDILDRLKSDKKSCKYFYKLYLKNIKESPFRSQNKWTQELGIQINDWWYIWSYPGIRNTNQ
jgi:hypothetical protein